VTKSTERRGRKLESAPSRRLSEAGLASRAEHRPSRGTFRSCVKVRDDLPEGPRNCTSFTMHHRVAIPPGEWQLESISSPWSLANCAFVQERSSLTVEGFCAPSVAPKKRKTPAFCRWAVEGGGEAGGVGPVDGLLGVKHPLKIPFTSAASRLPLCGCFFCSRKVTTRYDGRNPAGWMALSSRMRLGRRPKDDDPPKEMCPDGVRNGCSQIRCWAPIRPISGL